jgi:hypothetical protein
VIAASRGNQAALGNRVPIAGVLEGDPLDSNEGEARVERSERLLARRDFDDVPGGSVIRQANVNSIPRVLHPEPGVRLSPDFLHDRTWTSARRQPRTRYGRACRRGAGQPFARQFPKLLHRLQRLAVHKDPSAAAEIRPHVDRPGIKPGSIPRRACQGERIVGIGEHRAGEFVPPRSDRACTLPGRAEAAAGDRLLLPSVLEYFRTFDEDLGSRGGLVTDHLRWPCASPHRADALPVRAGGDDHAFARLQHLGCLVDRAEGLLPGARSVIIGPHRGIVDVVNFGKCQRLFPGDVLSAIGQARVRRNGLLIASGCSTGHFSWSSAKGGSA